MGKTVCFFGHRNTPESIRQKLHETLTNLIEKQDADTFYVGNQGRFDSMVLSELKKLKEAYPHIDYSMVLAYMPGKKQDNEFVDYEHTIYPDGLETVPPRFAIDKRNRIMVEWADIVVTYVIGSGGGAAKFKELAEKKKKTVFNIAEN